MCTKAYWGSEWARTVLHDVNVLVILAVTEGEEIKITFNSSSFYLKIYLKLL